MASKKGKMVLKGQGRGKFSSSYLVKRFGDWNPPKIGRYDMDCIIILFLIHVDVFRVEKLEMGLTHKKGPLWF